MRKKGGTDNTCATFFPSVCKTLVCTMKNETGDGHSLWVSGRGPTWKLIYLPYHWEFTTYPSYRALRSPISFARFDLLYPSLLTMNRNSKCRYDLWKRGCTFDKANSNISQGRSGIGQTGEAAASLHSVSSSMTLSTGPPFCKELQYACLKDNHWPHG